jgi:hypothetical protein
VFRSVSHKGGRREVYEVLMRPLLLLYGLHLRLGWCVYPSPVLATSSIPFCSFQMLWYGPKALPVRRHRSLNMV